MDWSDASPIAELLARSKPDIDPLTIRFPDLIQWVLALDGFAGPAKPADPLLLEEIQREWYARYRRR